MSEYFHKSKAIKNIKVFMNILLFIILLIIDLMLLFCIKGEWTGFGYIYSVDVRDLIRCLAPFEVLMSSIMLILSRNKFNIIVFIASNALAIYRFLDTYFLF